MRVGVFVSETWGEPSDLEQVRVRARQAEQMGFDGAWVPYLPWSLDALVALQAAGAVTQRLELGSAVIPTYLFHPLALARQAHSLRGELGGRLTLGVGCSQQVVIETMHGIPFERPARQVREYVEVLRASMAGTGQVNHEGQVFRVHAMFGTPGASVMPILVGALGSMMLRVAGEVADGTIATWCDEAAIERVIGPEIRQAASAAGRPEPRVGTVLPVLVTDDVEGCREALASHFSTYDAIPRYQRMISLGDCDTAAQVCVVGNERHVRERIRSFESAGLTDLLAAPFVIGDDEEACRLRTLECLAAL
ncbi:TIGR03564 family F420-dependent LLM class oxidoreductase [Myxococcota bacterium]|nr:TIGR03564 family F420-dependent LLM class oxidoreductase [Myxococcota bacterium]